MAIADKLLRLNEIKGDIKTAIINKGQSAGNDMSEYAGLIENIKTDIEPIIITSAEYLFSGQIPEEAFKYFKIVEPDLMNHMFYLNDAIKDIDMRKLNLIPNPNAVTFNNGFYNCDKLNSAILYPNLKLKSVMSMFQGCTMLTEIDMNNADVTECTDYRSYLNNCRLITEFDGSIFPNLKVANNNCQNFYYNTLGLRKTWIPKEWIVPPTTSGYALFISCGGSNKMNAGLTIFTDAISEEDQISKGRWSNFTLVYSSSGAKVPASQIRYGATHDEYEAF